MRGARALVVSCCSAVIPCQEPEPTPATEPEPAAEKSLFERLGAETGRVKVRDLATIDLPEEWGYLQQRQARRVVEEAWGNPPDASVLGMVLPPDFETSQWGIIVFYEDEGHVDDSDASSIDYEDLLADMQSSTGEANAERQKQGFPTAELVGWAEPPHYSAADKKLYWAKTLRFHDQEGSTLNYNVRILGRTGTLVMNAVADMAQLDLVADGCKQVLAGTEFVEGKRYADFDSSIDKVAAYGIGGLIAGKVLLKTGILAKLLKPLLIGVVILGGLFVRVFRRGKRREATAGDGANPA
jgi:uncharacterized membrane-anchored protein